MMRNDHKCQPEKHHAEMIDNVMDEFFDLFNTLTPLTKSHGMPDFCVKNFDRDNLTLKYPDNVIVVPSPSGVSPSPRPGEIRRHNITEAIEYASTQAAMGAARRWSILVHAGTFLNDCQMTVPQRNRQV